MPITFITGSRHKFEEAAAIIPSLVRHDLDLPEIQEIDAERIIAAKLAAARREIPGDLIVEDTSLHIPALGGLPGPLIKWFMKAIGNDGLHKLAECFGDGRAVARTTIGYADAAGEQRFFSGEVSGRIVAPRGESDFGWDPVFLPDGHERTFAEMDQAEKNGLSMRAEAVRKLRDFLAMI